jgi:phage protein U
MLSPQNISRTVSSRWTEHTTAFGKPKPEYLGADLADLSFDILLRADLGVKPREMLDSLSRMAEGSETYELIIGGVPVGENRWRLLQISETWETVYSGGELFQAKVSLKLSEYL